jgi:hypothetical protein
VFSVLELEAGQRDKAYKRVYGQCRCRKRRTRVRRRATLLQSFRSLATAVSSPPAKPEQIKKFQIYRWVSHSAASPCVLSQGASHTDKSGPRPAMREVVGTVGS